ncbi:hypothetical protein [Streptomyces sp. NPDC015130]|uniref:hypothetical protein n=1 Tax=Streptomyces sp. NPDC015130 TaxID=3364940 RepID=UPI0036F553CF
MSTTALPRSLVASLIEERIPSEVIDGLRAAALLEGCHLVVPGDRHSDSVLEIVHDSERFEAADAAVRAEIAGWTRTGAPGEGSETEGIPRRRPVSAVLTFG